MKPPRQDRSRETHGRIVEAAARLLGRGRSWSDITVAELVREAETSVGSFYNRFRDKDALLHVLQIELCEEGLATAIQAQELASAEFIPLDAAIRAFVALAVSSYRQQLGLRRALLVKMCDDREFRTRSSELARVTCEGLTDVLRARYPHIDRAAARGWIDVCHRLIYGTLDQNLLFGDVDPTGQGITDAALVEEVTIAIVAYLEQRVGRPLHA